MPFQSEKQRRYLHANHPEIAKRWERDYATGGRIGYRLGTEEEPKQNNLSGILENLTQEQVDKEPERYAQLLLELRPPDFFMGEHGNMMAYWRQPNGDHLGVPWGYTSSTLDYYPKAQGGRIGFDNGSNGITLGSDKYNITFEPGASGSLSSLDLGEGYEVDQKNIAYGVDTTANIGPLEIGMDYKKFLDKYDVTKDDVTVEKDTTRDRHIAYMLGLDLDTLYAKIDSDKDFKNFYFTIRKTFNQGGVVPAHEAGIYGLAEGGQLVKPGPGRPGYGGPQDWGAEAKGTGAYSGGPSDRGPRDDPDRSGPTIETTTTKTSTSNGFNYGEDQEEDVARMMKNLGIVDKYNAPDYGRGWVEAETDYGAGDYMGHQDKVRIQNDILTRKQQWDKKKWQRDVKTGVSAFTSITNPFSLGKFIYNQNKKKKERIAEIDEDLDMLNKIGATKFSQHTDTIYQQLEQEKLDLLQPKTRDTPDGGGEGTTDSIVYANIEDKNKKELASSQWLQKQEEVDRSKQMAYWRMMMKPYMSAQGGRVPAGYNTGGLSNLFKLKNV